MSLQPGPQDPNDESALTPPTAPPAADAGPPGDWASPPPPAPPQPGGQGFPPPPVEGWASPPPPAPGYGYAPPPGGSYAGPPQSYPPAGYPPQGYQAVGYPAARQTDSKAVIALILAISSWIVCPVITAIVALVLAGQSNRAIDASGGQLEGRSMNTATKVIAWINIVLSVLGLIALAGLLVFAASTDSTIITDLTDPSTQF